MGITKNKQTQETICRMAAAAFPGKQVQDITELTEGMCNAAYRIEFTDGEKSILKIAAAHSEGLMSNEVNLMDAEVKAMRMVGDSHIVKVAQVQYYDTSKALCSGNYFFMEMLSGQSCFSLGDKLTEEEKSAVRYEAGQIARRLTGLKGKRFGLLADEAHQYTGLYDFVHYLIANVLADAEKKDIVIGVPVDEILAGLAADRAVFDAVTQPTLVHWDMWDGNIFVKDGHISGIIDWERALWGEAFMDDRFRRHARNADFLRGYGQESFTSQERQRINWYDVFLYLTMMTEGAYRGYEDDSQYRWTKTLFEEAWRDLQSEAAGTEKRL